MVPRVAHELSCIGTVGEECCHINLKLMALCRVGRVGICHIVGGEFEVGCLLGMYHYAATNVHRLLQSVVPYGHLVEERPLVEAYYAMFGHVLSVNLLGIVHQFERKAQRTVVQHAIFLEAIWHDDAVAEHDGGRSASQTGTYVVAVETCAVVEANVAVSVANYGHEAYFVSKLPKHDIGQIAVNALRRYGVDTRFIARGGDRVGLYYAETGASMRPSKVIYDRAHSSIAEANPEDFDFDAIMEGAQWFHWSGITPAISDKAAELTRLACEAAKRHGVTVSVDLNFRKKLWTSEKAISVMRPLMQYVDVCIGNEEDAQLCLGFKPDADVEGGQTDASGYHKIFEQMQKEFGFKYVVSTLRESFSATHNGWKALIYNGKEFYESRRYDIMPIIDRVGGGDSFSGGLIHGLLTKPTQGEALEFAVAASALKHTINGDFNLVSVDEVEALAAGNANGRVQR
jgi:2-dehydro-3-deoxygluconokinase